MKLSKAERRTMKKLLREHLQTNGKKRGLDGAIVHAYNQSAPSHRQINHSHVKNLRMKMGLHFYKWGQKAKVGSSIKAESEGLRKALEHFEMALTEIEAAKSRIIEKQEALLRCL